MTRRVGLILDPYGEDKPSGLGLSVLELVRSIVAADQSTHFVIYTKKAIKKSLPIPGDNWEARVMNVRSIWRSGAKPLDASIDSYVFFTPCVPLFFRHKRIVVVVHDCAHFEMKARSWKAWWLSWAVYAMFAISFLRATKIVAVSQSTKDAVARFFPYAKNKTSVIHIGYIPLKDIHACEDVPTRFFLYSGTLKPRKNIANIIVSFAKYMKMENNKSPCQLVLTGATGGSYHQEMVLLAQNLGVADSVRFVGYVSEGELLCLYGKAVALVFPSLYEGFGMPLLEAMHAGLPVVTSNQGALAEVAGDAALLVDPRNVEDIANAMYTISSDESLRDSLRKRGHKRVLEFSWEKAGKEILELLDQNMSPNNVLWMINDKRYGLSRSRVVRKDKTLLSLYKKVEELYRRRVSGESLVSEDSRTLHIEIAEAWQREGELKRRVLMQRARRWALLGGRRWAWLGAKAWSSAWNWILAATREDGYAKDAHLVYMWNRVCAWRRPWESEETRMDALSSQESRR